jgi:hypothetical protein
MYSVVIVFMLVTVGERDLPIKMHGKFADEKACESAASIVEQNEHPLPDGVRIVCQRRAEVVVTATYNPEDNS